MRKKGWLCAGELSDEQFRPAETSASLAPKLPSRIALLDGLRAVSILLAPVGHSADSLKALRFLVPFILFGNLGVLSYSLW
jgi:hypothetical protein